MVGSTLAVGWIDLFALRSWVSRLHSEQNHNEIVSYFLAAVVLFYGVMVGLIAVGVWEQFTSTDEKVALEASALASLYHDVSAYPEPDRSRLQADLREYTRNVIDKQLAFTEKANHCEGNQRNPLEVSSRPGFLPARHLLRAHHPCGGSGQLLSHGGASSHAAAQRSDWPAFVGLGCRGSRHRNYLVSVLFFPHTIFYCAFLEVGRYDNAPAISPHIDYALRQIGGLRALYDCSVEGLPRMHRDFVDAYRLATLKPENRRSA
jgi:hypothetical protein